MSLLKDVIGYGTHAARPAAGSEGRLYYETDTTTLFRDNGTTWDALTLGSGSPGIVKLAETVVGVGGQQTFNFTSVPPDYARLELVIIGRSDGATSGSTLVVQFNADTTAANYKSSMGVFEDYISGQTAAAFPLNTGTAGASVGWFGGTDQTDGLDPNVMRLFIPDYTNATHHKVIQQQAMLLGPSDYESTLCTAWWLNTAAITDITLHMVTNKLIEGSTVRLYGVV